MNKTHIIKYLPTKQGSKVGKIYETGDYHFYTNENTFLDNLAGDINLYVLTTDKITLNDWYDSGGQSEEYSIHKADSERLVNLANEFKSFKVVATNNKKCDGVTLLDDEFLKGWVKNPVETLDTYDN